MHFDDRSHGFLSVGDVEIEAAVAAFLKLVFKVNFKVLVCILEPEVIAVARPVCFARSRLQVGDAVIKMLGLPFSLITARPPNPV